MATETAMETAMAMAMAIASSFRMPTVSWAIGLWMEIFMMRPACTRTGSISKARVLTTPRCR